MTAKESVMKKLFTVTAATALLCCALFSGCAPSGKIQGNYKEPTAEELQTALSSVDSDEFFQPAQNGVYGFDLYADVTYSSRQGNLLTEYHIKAEYSFSAQFEEENALPVLSGEGNLSLKVTLPDETADGGKVVNELEATLCNDSEFMYADGWMREGTEEKKTIKNKYPVSAESFLQDSDSTDLLPPDMDSAVAQFDLTELIGTLQQYNIEIGLDTSDGVKLRFRANQDTFAALAGTDTADGVSFQKDTMEAYLHIGSNGSLQGIAMNADCVYTIGEGETAQTISLGGVVSYSTTEKAVTAKIPDNPDDYTLDSFI